MYPVVMIRGIIFDKDGTLFDYGKVWGPMMSDFIRKSLEKTHLSQEKSNMYRKELLQIIGVDDLGRIYPNGVIFSHDEFLKAFWRIFILTMRYRLSPFYVGSICYRFLHHNEDVVEGGISEDLFPDAEPVIRAAYERGYIIGIVTNDTTASAELFLEKMRIRKYVSFLRTKNSNTKRKPNPEALEEFCRETGIAPEEVAIVGDAIPDMEFGRNGKAGYLVAVLTGFGDEKELSALADAIYPDIRGILEDKVLFPEKC